MIVDAAEKRKNGPEYVAIVFWVTPTMNPGTIAKIRYTEKRMTDMLMLLITKLMSEKTFGLRSGGDSLKRMKNKIIPTMEIANNKI